MQSRHTAIDIAKGLGIVLVVLGHDRTVGGWGWPGWMIFSFHMPLFFVLSGAFLRPSDDMRRFAVSRFHAILKPCFVVALLVAAAKWLAGTHGMIAPVGAGELFGGVLYGTGATLMWTPMWYLPHLFIASCTGLLLLKALAGRPQLMVPLCSTLLAGGVFAIGRLPELPWSADLLPISVPFMLAGWHLRDRIFAARFRTLHCAVAMAVFVMLNLAFDARMDLNMRVYDDLLVNTAEAGCGVYLVLTLASRLQNAGPPSRLFSTLGSASLFILMFHHPIQTKVLTVLQARGMSDLGASALAVTAGLVLPLLVWDGARRLPPLGWLLLPPVRAPHAPTSASPAQTSECARQSQSEAPQARTP
ncbi:acyltransferase family protein [Piscinibacter sp. HJYY11]|uniref:acyltransferase family protein n=1 Tax=Piscinibacter sp. HJYY11 TaxID=2801333 RepID=UPI001F00996F|nr:acyltransferase family protein [Piscinibacter sp. HJYY11]